MVIRIGWSSGILCLVLCIDAKATSAGSEVDLSPAFVLSFLMLCDDIPCLIDP